MDESDINRRISNHWDREARLWAKTVREQTDIYREGLALPAFLDMVGDVRGMKILDIACGEGSVTRELAARGAHMTAIDLSPAMIDLAVEEEGREPLGIEYHVGNSANMNAFEDSSFDMVVCFMAVMDIAAVDSTFTEVACVLKPGGRFIFNVLHPCFSAPVSHWVYKEDAPDTDENRLYFAVDRYFDRGSIEEHLTLTDVADEPIYLTRIRFHRTLEDYVRSLARANFHIHNMCESVASGEMIRKFPKLDRSRRIPSFLLVDARLENS